MKDSDFVRLQIAVVTKPPEGGGVVDIVTDRFWGVTDDECILLYGGHSRQCNSNEEIAKKVCGGVNHPATSVRFIKTVYLAHDCRDFI